MNFRTSDGQGFYLATVPKSPSTISEVTPFLPEKALDGISIVAYQVKVKVGIQ
jgi:hypothetical protein